MISFDSQESTKAPVPDLEEAKRKIADCDRKLGQYRAALDEGETRPPSARGSPRPKPERARHELSMRKVTGNRRMTEAEIKAIVDKRGSIAEVLNNADPLDRRRSLAAPVAE